MNDKNAINNPKKNNLWTVMKNIQTTYYYMDKFERFNDNKFVEDNTELSKIGLEMFDNFGIDNINVHFFVDICAAPGMYSKIIFDKMNGKGTGIGISLPPEKGGVKFEFNNNNYKQFYKDILEKEYKIDIPKKLDFGMASCVSYKDDKKNIHTLNMELIVVSMNLIMNNLTTGGNMIINMSMKNIYTCFNILNLLLEQFEDIKLWKSSNVWGLKNTFYVFCYNFKNNNYKDNVKKYTENIKDNESKFNNYYIGDSNSFNKITNLMNNIYITRINCWLNIIK
jgi:hypothetical protein